MIKFLIPVLLLTPSLAMGSSRCTVESISEIDLDLVEVSALQISIGPDKLLLDGGDGADGVLRIRKCASTQARLDALKVEQAREAGGLLRVELDHGGRHNTFSSGWFFSRNDYGYFEISGRIPASLAVELTVGSGDAAVNNVAALEAVVGSGDLEVRQVAGTFKAQVGSGDIEAEDVGGVEIGNIGSGSIRIVRVGGDASAGNIGSGDLDLRDVQGSVRIGAIGSGDATLRGIGGDVDVRALGSGDINARDVGGNLTLRSKGSGDVSHRGVAGEVSLPRR